MTLKSLPLSFRFSIILAFSSLVSLFFGGMILVEMLGIPGTVSTGKYERQREDTLDDMELVSGLLSQRISDWFKETRNDVDALAKSPLLRQVAEPRSAAGDELLKLEFDSFMVSHNGVTAMSLYDWHGHNRVNAGNGDYPADISGLGISGPNLARLVLPGYLETISLQQQPNGQTFLRIIHQVYSQERPDKLIGLLISESNIGQALTQVIWTVSMELSPDWECIIASSSADQIIQIRKNRSVGNPQAEIMPPAGVFQPLLLALAGIEGPYDGPDENGNQVLAFHRQVKIDSSIGVGLVMRMDRNIAFRPAQQDLGRQLFLWLFLLAGVIGLGIVLASQISQPIKDLVRVARRVEAGDLSARAPVRRNSEIGQLAGVFNGMVCRLEDWNRDLEQQVQARTRELRLLTIRQDAILSAVPDIICEVDIEKTLVWINGAGYAFYGDDVLGKEVAEFFVGEQDTYQIVQPLFDGSQRPIYVESWQRRKDGQARLLAWWCRSLIDEAGVVTGSLSTARDITGQRQAEEKVAQALREKETLLREIYHRTKNTLQVIQGMLVLQAAEHPASDEFQELVRITEQRILAISLVHQMLYRSQDLSMVVMRDYIQELAGLIIQSSNRGENQIQLRIAVSEVRFPIDLAIPLGLILNELMSNSLKHAWQEQQLGLITISLDELGNNSCLLSYSDDGAGLGAGYDFRNQNGLGLKLVFSIGEQQLAGRVSMQGEGGLHCRLEFPTNLVDARV